MTDLPQPPLPAVILTGFLGAGKTTLLRRLLSTPDSPRLAVLVNDFGEINIDAALVTEVATDDVIALQNGCICCSIQDDLVEALDKVLAQSPRPDRLVIEASGVSRPLQIAGVFEDERLAGQVVLDAVLCLVDCDQFLDLDFASTELAMDQVAGSDLAILNKCDLASDRDIARIETTLRSTQPRLQTLRAKNAEVPLDLITGLQTGARDAHAAHHAHDHTCGSDCDHDHAHDQEFRSWSWQTEDAIDFARLRQAMQSLPSGFLRGKGVFQSTGGDRVVFDLVGKRRALRREDGPLPRQSSLVLLARHEIVDPAALTELFNGCRSTAPVAV